MLHRERALNAAERERLERLLSNAEERERELREELEEAKAGAERARRRSLQDHQRGFDQPGLRNDTGEPDQNWTTPSPIDPSKVKPGDLRTPPPEVEQRWPAR